MAAGRPHQAGAQGGMELCRTGPKPQRCAAVPWATTPGGGALSCLFRRVYYGGLRGKPHLVELELVSQLGYGPRCGPSLGLVL